ncbi:hypothetical protein WG899_06625 [Paucibacter sp. AS339]|uniref:hypothetical protein n=1 Tax=Paucibacter hankyongi TaxID=3133434 RepID=UPI0030A633F4
MRKLASPPRLRPRPWAASLMLVGLVQLAPLAQAQVVVIVHPSVAALAPKSEQIANLFLGKVDSLPGSPVLTPIDQSEGKPTRSQFYKAVANRDEAQIKAYWSRIMFTGRAQAPRALGSDAEVKRLVAATPGAIGYIDKAALDGTVKVLAQY